ncbi:MAG TPA: hypothetical protein DEO84_06460 [candidate division Zixibacteria bacterium]|jgi:hypothetical protein|nr:hypothetical protein [candidate division Zixibacteria bacterium]
MGAVGCPHPTALKINLLSTRRRTIRTGDGSWATFEIADHIGNIKTRKGARAIDITGDKPGPLRRVITKAMKILLIKPHLP